MRQFLGIIAFIVSNGVACGQHTEFSVQAGSGLFSFGGPRAVSETWANGIPPYLANPYGRKSGFSYTVAAQVQRVTKDRVLYGIQGGYESLSSQVAVTAVLGDFGPPIPTNGQGTLKSQFVTTSLFAGKRLGNNRRGVDITAGIDIGIGLSSREQIERLESRNVPFSSLTGLTRRLPDVDLRPRLNVTGYYRAFGLSLGYSHGLTNYAFWQSGNDAKAYSRMLRFSIAYRLGSKS